MAAPMRAPFFPSTMAPTPAPDAAEPPMISAVLLHGRSDWPSRRASSLACESGRVVVVVRRVAGRVLETDTSRETGCTVAGVATGLASTVGALNCGVGDVNASALVRVPTVNAVAAMAAPATA